MSKLDNALLRIALAFWAFFGFLIAIEAGFVSARFRGEGVFFRWQLWLLAGIFVVAVRDLLASLRCRICNGPEIPMLPGLLLGKMLCRPCLEHSILMAGPSQALGRDVAGERCLP